MERHLGGCLQDLQLLCQHLLIMLGIPVQLVAHVGDVDAILVRHSVPIIGVKMFREIVPGLRDSHGFPLVEMRFRHDCS
jgi:hypothetical protein